jgi:hypothetical protein
MKVAPSGLPRDPETFGSCLLIEPLKIDEPQQLDLFGLEKYPFRLVPGAAAGCIAPGFRCFVNDTPQARPSPAGTGTYVVFFLCCQLRLHYVLCCRSTITGLPGPDAVLPCMHAKFRGLRKGEQGTCLFWQSLSLFRLVCSDAFHKHISTGGVICTITGNRCSACRTGG